MEAVGSLLFHHYIKKLNYIWKLNHKSLKHFKVWPSFYVKGGVSQIFDEFFYTFVLKPDLKQIFLSK